jgi:GNAT superfamily N-acetyltransferase
MTPARSILIEVRGNFSDEMERLRREYSDRNWPGGVSEDEFDRDSVHVTAFVEGELAGMVRLTSRPLSVLSAWAVGQHQVPVGDDIVEATRGVVARKWRGIGLYKVLMAEATRYCHHRHVSRVVAAIEPDFPLRGYLEWIGFRPVGPPSWFHNPPNGATHCQVILQEPALAVGVASAALAGCIAELGKRGFSIRSSVLDVVSLSQSLQQSAGGM